MFTQANGNQDTNIGDKNCSVNFESSLPSRIVRNSYLPEIVSTKMSTQANGNQDTNIGDKNCSVNFESSTPSQTASQPTFLLDSIKIEELKETNFFIESFQQEGNELRLKLRDGAKVTVDNIDGKQIIKIIIHDEPSIPDNKVGPEPTKIETSSATNVNIVPETSGSAKKVKANVAPKKDVTSVWKTQETVKEGKQEIVEPENPLIASQEEDGFKVCKHKKQKPQSRKETGVNPKPETNVVKTQAPRPRNMSQTEKVFYRMTKNKNDTEIITLCGSFKDEEMLSYEIFCFKNLQNVCNNGHNCTKGKCAQIHPPKGFKLLFHEGKYYYSQMILGWENMQCSRGLECTNFIHVKKGDQTSGKSVKIWLCAFGKHTCEAGLYCKDKSACKYIQGHTQKDEDHWKTQCPFRESECKHIDDRKNNSHRSAQANQRGYDHCNRDHTAAERGDLVFVKKGDEQFFVEPQKNHKCPKGPNCEGKHIKKDDDNKEVIYFLCEFSQNSHYECEYLKTCKQMDKCPCFHDPYAYEQFMENKRVKANRAEIEQKNRIMLEHDRQFQKEKKEQSTIDFLKKELSKNQVVASVPVNEPKDISTDLGAYLDPNEKPMTKEEFVERAEELVKKQAQKKEDAKSEYDIWSDYDLNAKKKKPVTSIYPQEPEVKQPRPEVKKPIATPLPSNIATFAIQIMPKQNLNVTVSKGKKRHDKGKPTKANEGHLNRFNKVESKSEYFVPEDESDSESEADDDSELDEEPINHEDIIKPETQLFKEEKTKSKSKMITVCYENVPPGAKGFRDKQVTIVKNAPKKLFNLIRKQVPSGSHRCPTTGNMYFQGNIVETVKQGLIVNGVTPKNIL
jgi:hypothetical protein